MDVTSSMEESYAQESTSELLSQFQSKVLHPEHPLTLHVTSIVSALLEASDLGYVSSPEDRWSPSPSSPFPNTSVVTGKSTRKKWNVIVVDDPSTINAMATWGNVVVFTGILPICATPSGLAGVVGHEIAHVTLRHPSERLSLMKAFSVLQIFFDLVGIDVGLSRIFTWLVVE
jgi:metalloendopeptidase OMA1, mitochondrial